MKKFKFGGLETPGLYLDETVMRMCYTHRRIFMQLALTLIQEGQKEKAAEVLAYADKHIPYYNVPVDYFGSLDEARAYYQLGKNDKAMKLLKALWTKSEQYLNWYLNLDGFRFRSAQTDCVRHFYIMQQVNMLGAAIDDAWASKNIEKLSSLTSIYAGKGGQFPN